MGTTSTIQSKGVLIAGKKGWRGPSRGAGMHTKMIVCKRRMEWANGVKNAAPPLHHHIEWTAYA